MYLKPLSTGLDQKYVSFLGQMMMEILLKVAEQFFCDFENSWINWEGAAREWLNWSPAQRVFLSTKYDPAGIWFTCQLSQWPVIFSKYRN